MALTAGQTQRTEALHIDVEVKFYTAVAADVTATGITDGSAYSPAGEWTEITSIVARPVRFSETWDENRCLMDWRASVGGVSYNSTTLGRGRLMLAMRRLWPDSTPAAWTGWTVWWCGYIESVIPARDDHDESGEWTANIRSLSFLLESTDCPAHNFSRVNLCDGGTATASSTLTTVVSEAGKGEFLGLPSVEASRAIDGNMDTLWISNLAPAATADTVDATNAPNITINEMYREPIGYGASYRWLELYKAKGDDGESLKHWNIYSTTGGLLDFNSLGSSYTMNVGDYVILCANRARFQELFDAGSTPVIDWRHITAWGVLGAVDGASWTYDPTGDFIAMGQTQISALRVGTGSIDGTGWDGAAVAAPAAGHSVKRVKVAQNFSGDYSKATDWAEENYPSPGAHHTATDTDWEWLAVDLGAYSWTLAEDMAVDATEVEISPDTEGLTDSGQIIIGADIIDYTGKTDDHLTGLSNIAVGGHSATDALSQYENEAATTHPKLGAVQWKRRYGLQTTYNGALTNAVPEHFRLYISTEASPSYPPTASWELDWEAHPTPGVWDYNSFEWEYVFPEDQADGTRPRGRHVMLVIKQMRDHSRAKINEFKVFPDQWAAETDTYLDKATAKVLIEHLLIDHYGLATGQVSVAEGAKIGSVSTQKADYVSVISELCRRTGTILRFQRDLKVYVINDPLFPMHDAVDTEYTFDRQAACEIRPSFAWPDTVGQVEMTARNVEEEVVYQVTWPQTAAAGAVRKIYGEAIVGSEDDAYKFAEAHFRRARAAERVELTTSGITDEWCRPRKRVALNWDMDAAGTLVDFDTDLFLVTGIDVTLDFGHPKEYSETVQLVEYIA